MKLSDTIERAKIYFPNLQVKYKDESWFMKLLGYLLFFNKSFMTDYTTTIGSTIYFPSRAKVEAKEISYIIVFLHELVHIKDATKYSRILFSFLYLFPQIFAPFSLLLLLISWKITLPIFILLLLPLPAYFRMYFEKRAYLVSLYAIKALGRKLKFSPMLLSQKDRILKQFTGPSYYYMWIFDMDEEFVEYIIQITAGKRPYYDPIFDIIDDLINHP